MGKPNCGLCEEMRAIVRGALGEGERLDELDVRDHPDLERRYVFEIPVLLHGGRELARHRITPEEARVLVRGLRRDQGA